MFYNLTFWTATALLFTSAMNINVYFEQSGSRRKLKQSIALFGGLAFVAGIARLINLSIEYDWWWLFGGVTVFLLSVGALSYLLRHSVRNVFGILNFVLIPFFWWYGSRFNTILSTEWFYSLTDSIRSFLLS